MPKQFFFAARVLVLFCLVKATAFADITTYSIDPIGLTDAAHTRSSDGFQESLIVDETTNGDVGGRAELFDSNGNDIGQSSWIYNGSVTTQVGLSDATHTNPVTGGHRADLLWINENNQAAGRSSRFANDGGGRGYTAWTYNGTNTVAIGLLDAEHTTYGGSVEFAQGWSDGIAANGHVTGYSFRYDGTGNYAGRSAWIYDGTQTTRIGMMTPTGLEEPVAINSSGQVIGYNDLGTGATTAAWIYDGTNTIRIGLTEDDGQGNQVWLDRNVPEHLSDSGLVSGRNGGTSTYGSTNWLYDGTDTFQIGLMDAEHTSSSGYNQGLTEAINNAGQVVGRATRYTAIGGNQHGFSAWFYDGQTSIKVGLIAGAHTRSDGWQDNTAFWLTDNGKFYGVAKRYDANNEENGRSIWHFDGNTTQRIGYFDAAHTRSSDGEQNSLLLAFNKNTGYAAGYSHRYDQPVLILTGWLFDGVNLINLGTPAVNGWPNVSVVAEYIDDDGMVVGKLFLYDANGNSGGERAFIYTQEDGIRIVDQVVNESFATQGWTESTRALATSASAPKDILGYGFLDHGGQMAFKLTPEQRTEVSIDVLPGDPANQVFPNQSGRLPVAVLGDASFDATQVDPATLRFGPGFAAPATPPVIEDVDGQYGDDTTVKFEVPESGIVCNATEVRLLGETYAGDAFGGFDSIDASNCASGGCHAY